MADIQFTPPPSLRNPPRRRQTDIPETAAEFLARMSRETKSTLLGFLFVASSGFAMGFIVAWIVK